MTPQPLVTAIITTKNRADLLPRALHSVFNQTYNNLEVVLVDDGSTDTTPDLLAKYQKKESIRLIRNDKSQGACRARNQGIQLANGEFIAGLDDDDEWHPERISILMNHYDDSYACVTSNDRMVSDKNSIEWHKQETVQLEDLLYSNCVGNQVLVKKERVLEVGGFDESLEAAQDYDLWIRLCEKFGPVHIVQKPLQTIYRDSAPERITNPAAQLRGYLSVYQKHRLKMDRKQRRYHLFNIRLAQGKVSSIFELIRWVPRKRLWKELKRWISDRYLLS